MSKSNFNPIDLSAFEERTGNRRETYLSAWADVHRVVSMRDLTHIEAVQLMPIDYLMAMLANIRLVGHPDIRPYAGCRVDCLRLDPAGLLVGQTFVERPNYQRILEDFGNIFSRFAAPRGVAKITALIVLGRDVADEHCVAHYVPPIVEAHGSRLILMDGMHRNFLVRQVGTTIESIIVRDVKTPFPCDPHPWSSVEAVDVKPPPEKRFFNLKRDLFRDVKAIGIDG